MSGKDMKNSIVKNIRKAKFVANAVIFTAGVYKNVNKKLAKIKFNAIYKNGKKAVINLVSKSEAVAGKTLKNISKSQTYKQIKKGFAANYKKADKWIAKSYPKAEKWAKINIAQVDNFVKTSYPKVQLWLRAQAIKTQIYIAAKAIQVVA